MYTMPLKTLLQARELGDLNGERMEGGGSVLLREGGDVTQLG